LRATAKDCFCGCGRTVSRFPLGMRSINTRGRQVVERLVRNETALERAPVPSRDGDDIGMWFAQGDAIVRELAAVTHGEADPRLLDERYVRQWQSQGREIERYALMIAIRLERDIEAGVAEPDLDLSFLDDDQPEPTDRS
jgi:hypothetical protein